MAMPTVEHYLNLGSRKVLDATAAANVAFENGFPRIIDHREYQPEYRVAQRRLGTWSWLTNCGHRLLLKVRNIWAVFHHHHHHVLWLEPKTRKLDCNFFEYDQITRRQILRLRR